MKRIGTNEFSLFTGCRLGIASGKKVISYCLLVTAAACFLLPAVTAVLDCCLGIASLLNDKSRQKKQKEMPSGELALLLPTLLYY